MSTLQESLKASSGIDVKEMLENFSGKGNVRQSIDDLRIEFAKKEPNAAGTKEKAAEVTSAKGE
jgi:flotillin